MENECKSLNNCGFFKKYQQTKDLACRGFIKIYCKGENIDKCKRMEFKKNNGVAPSDDMMPSGQFIKV